MPLTQVANMIHMGLVDFQFLRLSKTLLWNEPKAYAHFSWFAVIAGISIFSLPGSLSGQPETINKCFIGFSSCLSDYPMKYHASILSSFLSNHSALNWVHGEHDHLCFETSHIWLYISCPDKSCSALVKLHLLPIVIVCVASVSSHVSLGTLPLFDLFA